MWTLFDRTVKTGTAIRRDKAAKGTFQVKMTDALSTARDQLFFMLEDVNNVNSENDMISRQFTAEFVH